MAQKKLQKRKNSLWSIHDFRSSYISLFRKSNFSIFLHSLLKEKGFTLIELVVGIGVLAILATLAFAAINPVEQFKKAQDLRRKGDISQLQRALESYYQDFGRYPASSSNKIAPSGTTLQWGDGWAPYMDVLPKDPTSSKNYTYWSDSTGQTYRIYASLDRALRDDKACHPDNGSSCDNLGPGQSCGGVCNFGATSSNISP